MLHELVNFRYVTLPETNSSPLKIDLPKRKVAFQPSIFNGYVSFRDGSLPEDFLTPSDKSDGLRFLQGRTSRVCADDNLTRPFAEETGFFERDWTSSVNFVFGQIGNFCVGYLIFPKNQRLTHQLGGVCLHFFLGSAK